MVDDEKQGNEEEGGSTNDEDRDEDGDGEQDDGDREDKNGVEEGEEATNHKLDLVWRLLAEHSIQDNGIDGRDAMFQFNVNHWRDALHPKLSFLAPMLQLLCKQVQLEYSCHPSTPGTPFA